MTLFHRYIWDKIWRRTTCWVIFMYGHVQLSGGIWIENFEENLFNVLILADNIVDQKIHKAINGRFLFLAFENDIFKETSDNLPWFFLYVNNNILSLFWCFIFVNKFLLKFGYLNHNEVLQKIGFMSICLIQTFHHKFIQAA